jgi:hypothetical protein
MSLLRGLQREQSIYAPSAKQPGTWTTISFDIRSGLSLYFGVALLLINLLVTSGVVSIWMIPQWGQTAMQTNLIRVVFFGWLIVFPTFSGLFLVTMGFSDKNRRIVLDQTKLVFDPLFWREKIVVRYEQIEEVVWYYKQRFPGRADRIGIAVHYHPLNSHQQIDESRFYKLVITGVAKEVELLEELQKRRTGTSLVDRVPVLPNFPNRMLVVAIAGSLFFCPILLLVLIELLPLK